MKKALEGKVAIVTGASRGIGESIAVALACNGAEVVLAARSKGALEDVRLKIESGGGCAIGIPADVSVESEMVSLISQTVNWAGRLDILVNNAGMGIFKPLLNTTIEEWDTLMAVNARSVFLLCREAIPYLELQKHSFIVNVVSVAGVKGYVNQGAYSASKHAVMGMTKSLAKEVQDYGIRVHAICPGGVDTRLIDELNPDGDRTVLMKPQEIADIVLFLVTRSGNAVTDEIHVRRSNSLPWA